MGDKKRVAVIFGGQSSEHEVSRLSAESVIRNIDRDKFDVVMIGITKDGRWLPYDGPVELLGTGEWQAIAEKQLENMHLFPKAGQISNKLLLQKDGQYDATDGQDFENKLADDMGQGARQVLFSAGAALTVAEKDNRRVDVVFPVLHGCNGEDGTIQGMLELAGIPYVGCGVLSSALGMDKAYAKVIFEKEGIPQGKYLVFNRKQIAGNIEELINKVEETLTYPCFVKPSNAGSSVGVSKARDRESLVSALKLAARYDRRILVEEFIDGREAECAVLGNDDPVASTVGEVVPCNEFYDYEAKYLSGDSSKIIIPANLPADVIEKIRDYAVRAFKAIDGAGLARVDFFVRKDSGEVLINEINTMPGFTQISMYSKLWAASGLPYGKLIERLIELAMERYEDSRREI